MQPLFVLEEPQYHRIGSLVRGAVLAVDGPPIERVAIWRGDERVAVANVDLPCPELAPMPFANSATSRFQCELRFERDRVYEVRAGDVKLFAIDTSFAPRHAALDARVSQLPVPPPDLVNTTQGGTNTRSYADSAVSGFFSISSFLGDVRNVDRVLDIGCGTGRLLLGWHADRPDRRLVGVDINRELIDWAAANLGSVGEWRVSNVVPPLPFDSASFDVIQLASVFTHLPLDVQRQWLAEIHRLLAPRGAAVISLHGEIYARVLLGPEQQQQYASSGYVEVAGAEPGANAFSTFHTRAFAERLFGDFASMTFFERGSDADPPRLTPIAALQDVYVLRK